MRELSLFQIILLCVFGSFAIAGVLIFALVSSQGTGSSVGRVVIWGTMDKTQFSEALRLAAEVNTDLLNVTYERKDPSTFSTELTNALASGKGPDLVLIRQDEARQQTQRVIPWTYTEISREQYELRFIDAASPYLAPEGIIALPFLADPLVLYWNKDILNTYGYSEAPAVWGELFDMVPLITQKNDTGTLTRATIALGQYENVPHAKLIMSALIMQAGGSIVSEGQGGVLQATLSQGASSQASVAALRFFTEFADPSKPSYSWNAAMTNARDSFLKGETALYIGLASENASLKLANPNLNYAMAAIPQRKDSVSMNSGYVYGLAVPRTSPNPLGAKTVAYIMVSKDIAPFFSSELGIPSARRDLLNDPASKIALPNSQAIIMRSWVDPDTVRTNEIFKDMIEGVVTGRFLHGEAIDRAHREIAVAIDRLISNITQ